MLVGVVILGAGGALSPKQATVNAAITAKTTPATSVTTPTTTTVAPPTTTVTVTTVKTAAQLCAEQAWPLPVPDVVGKGLLVSEVTHH